MSYWKTRIAVVAAVAGLLAAGGAAWMYGNAIENAAVQETRADGLEQALADQKEAFSIAVERMEKVETAAGKAMENRKAAEEKAERLKREIQEIADEDESDYQDCRDVRLPDGIRERLRDAARQD